MIEVTLKPVAHFTRYSLPLRAEIMDYFNSVLYGPLHALIDGFGVEVAEPKGVRRNSLEPSRDPAEVVSSALASRQIWYANGVFSGKFNASISRDLRRLGANSSEYAGERVFRLPVDVLPYSVHAEVVSSALASRQIWYANGVFSGKFNASISRALRRLGANSSGYAGERVFRLPVDVLPYSVRAAVVTSAASAAAVHQAVLKFLADATANLPSASTGISVERTVELMVQDLGKQFASSVTNNPEAAFSIGEVTVDMSENVRKQMTEKLTANINLDVKTFTEARVLRLRKLVEANAKAGYRTEKLAEIIRAEFGVGERKAKFLADNETSLFAAKYREARAREVGMTEYKWITSGRKNVRHDHRELNGRIFSYDNPPVVDQATGRRGNPGEDYNCQCVGAPILRALGIEADQPKEKESAA